MRYTALSCLATMALVGAMLVMPASADGTDLKSLILMPGPLTRSHADEEQNCEACHSSFDKSAQNSLCLACHEPVAQDRRNNTGFHGRASMARKADCKACHTDHQGREFNIVPLDVDTFNHVHTDFPLQGKHIPVGCESCHQVGTQYRDTTATCFGCHEDDDQHRGSLGRECADCHTAQAWNMPQAFDHADTDFELLGQHKNLSCGSCHAGEKYQFDELECNSCHQLRDVHLGRYGQECQRCHSQEDWATPVFDHNAETTFKLLGAHRDSACQACHLGDLTQNAISKACVACHRSSDIHAGRHGEQCQSCHNSSDWNEARFDHSKETNWPLLGQHEKLSCLQCHQGSLQDSPDSECIDCHRVDDVHQSDRLADCRSCHQPAGWHEVEGFDHELAQFPLEGMHAIAHCQSCHASAEFHRAETACAECHQTDDVHKSSMGEQCGSCHTPNGWLLWTFDHNSATDFELAGAHAGLACAGCHADREAADVPRDCAGCHADIDRHEGNFGRNCGRCHSTESFGEIQWRN